MNGRRSWRICLALVVASGGLMAQDAIPESSRAAAKACGNEKLTFEEQIAGCDALIAGGSPFVEQRAIFYRTRGDVYDRHKDYDKALADYDEAIKLAPRSSVVYNAYFARGIIYKQAKKDPDHAIADFTRLIELQPREYANDTYYLRGLTYFDKGKHERAIEDFNVAIQLKPKGNYYHARANALVSNSQADRAMADFDEALKLDPTIAAAYNNRGIQHAAKGDYERAIADYSAALKLMPEFAEVYNNRGVAYRNTGRYDLAIADLNKAIKYWPELAPAWGNRGSSYLKKGSESDLDKAIADSEHALKLLPKMTWVSANLKEARDAKAALLERAKAVGSGRRIALIIGNATYDNTGPLPNALNDARDIAGELTKLGYKIYGHPVTNLKKAAMTAEIEKFRKAAVGSSAAIVWYAGHGLVMAEENSQIPVEWVIPVDAKINSRKDAATSAIRLGELSNAVLAAKTLRLVVMDACRDTRFYTGKRGLSPHRDSNPGVVIVYSAQPGQLAQDGPEDGNSPFVQAFLESLRKQPKVDVRLLFGAVAGRTQELTGVERQQPQLLTDIASSDVLAFAP